MPTDDLIGTVEAAARADVSLPTIKKAAQLGALRVAVKMPGRTGAYLFRPRDVDQWASRRRPVRVEQAS
jgi:hypothetical protein